MSMVAGDPAVPRAALDGQKGSLRISGRGGVDVVVVYKVDRLTRSLSDFAKRVELFDEHGVPSSPPCGKSNLETPLLPWRTSPQRRSRASPPVGRGLFDLPCPIGRCAWMHSASGGSAGRQRAHRPAVCADRLSAP